MSLTAMLVADTIAPAVLESLRALASAVDEAEAVGLDVEVLVLTTRDDPDIDQVLEGVEGAKVVRSPGKTRLAAVASSLHLASGSAIWVSATDSAPSPRALTRLYEAVTAGCAAAVPHSTDPGAYATVRADVCARWIGRVRDDDDPVDGLLAVIAAQELDITTVDGAGAVRSRIRNATGEIDRGMPVWAASEARVLVGPATYGAPRALAHAFGPLDEIEIGGYCSIADEARLLVPVGRTFTGDGEEITGMTFRDVHRVESASSYPIGYLVPEESYDEYPPGSRGERLVVGDDVWIGYRATVIGSLTIGTGAVIAAGALVRSDVPPYAVVAGVPARVVKWRFDDQTIERLLAVRWWDWPLETVRGAHRWFTRPVSDFLRHFDPAGELPGHIPTAG